MKKIYREDNYVVVENDGKNFVFPINHSEYNEHEDHFFIRKFPNKKAIVLSFDNVFEWSNKDGSEQFSITSLREFLRKNTGFNTASGGSDASSEESLGWIQISDSQFTESSPMNVLQNNRTLLINNGNSILDLVGMSGSTTIWNTTTNKIQPNNIGDSFDIRVQFKVNPNLNNRNLTLDLDIGGTQGVIWSKTIRLARGANVDTQVTEQLDIYALGTFVTNGGTLNVTCDGDISVYDIVFKIERKFIND